MFKSNRRIDMKKILDKMLVGIDLASRKEQKSLEQYQRSIKDFDAVKAQWNVVLDAQKYTNNKMSDYLYSELHRLSTKGNFSIKFDLKVSEFESIKRWSQNPALEEGLREEQASRSNAPTPNKHKVVSADGSKSVEVDIVNDSDMPIDNGDEVAELAHTNTLDNLEFVTDEENIVSEDLDKKRELSESFTQAALHEKHFPGDTNEDVDQEDDIFMPDGNDGHITVSEQTDEEEVYDHFYPDDNDGHITISEVNVEDDNFTYAGQTVVYHQATIDGVKLGKLTIIKK
jgi:hypothetical protein